MKEGTLAKMDRSTVFFLHLHGHGAAAAQMRPSRPFPSSL